MHNTVTAPVENEARLKIAALVAIAGLATAWAMSASTTSLRFHLPESGFHLAATVGAGIAGFFFANGFGRKGTKGLFLAAISAVGVTLAGAALGAALISPVEVSLSGSLLGWIAILEAVDEPGIFKKWFICMVLLQILAEKIRETST